MMVVSESNMAMETEWKRRSREIAPVGARHSIASSDEPRKGRGTGGVRGLMIIAPWKGATYFMHYIVAPFQGANHFSHLAPGFLAPPGLRHPGLSYVMPLAGLLRRLRGFLPASADAPTIQKLPSWGTERN